MRSRHALLLITPALLLAACAEHIGPYRAKHREFDAIEYTPATHASPGSLFNRDVNDSLFENDRAHRVGDIVVIQIEEADSGSHDTSSKMGSANSSSIGTSGILDLLKKAAPSLDLASLAGIAAKSDFSGNGTVTKQGKLNASLSVRVLKVMPNGNFLLEGTKVVMVGGEEHHLYVSGLVRQGDIRNDGTVSSSRIADAEIEFAGRGIASDYDRPGWLSRLWKKFSPF